MKNPLTVVEIGYTKICFPSSENAIEFYRLAMTAIPVERIYGKLLDGRDSVSLIRSDEISISLERIAGDKIELQYTKEELDKRAEAKSDVDVDATVISDPLAIDFEDL